MSPYDDDPVTEAQHNGDPTSLGQQFAELSGVSRTLLIPLLARHLAGQRPDPILGDPAASDYALSVRTTFRRIGRSGRSRPARPSAVSSSTTPSARLSTLTRARRSSPLAPGCAPAICVWPALDAAWVDIDLAPVAELRDAALPAAPRRIVLAGSILDDEWREHLAESRGPHVFVLEGLTMYLHEREVRTLVTGLADTFPDSHLLIETVGPRHDPPGRWQQLRDRRITGVQFSWGVRDPATVTGWHPRLGHIATWHVMDYHASAWPLLIRVLRRIPSIRRQSKVSHLHVL